ncbi:citrate lyase subunit beta/citryl-CoA lyase [Streptomyces sp. Ag109_G2-6]|uniref:HpcH/HpaI aldolase/citrate lyase family protein n=1 Tax=Streptomyces TaxID=1883 RepID=UPI0009A4BD06|nr:MULTISPECIES: aldolase/citrate lyase family protein [Streptomyces]RPF44532.1 citrate lyase subunit beta/citryl-CoA lyase [Streptomyces sp. Ag109_G2-6]
MPPSFAGTRPSPVVRTWLYVPGDRPERFGKAVASGADAVVIDLEDAVAPARKAAARGAAVGFLGSGHGRAVFVRVNALGDGGEEDLAALRGTRVSGVRIPKCEHPAQLAEAARLLPGVRLVPLLETALGIEHAYALATGHAQVSGLAFGEADLAAELGTGHRDVLDAAAHRVLLAAAAAGLPRPPLSVFPAVRDLDGLAADCARGRERGFFGRSVVHPAQVPVVNAAFTAPARELEAARRLVERVERAEANGSGAWLDEAGNLIDAAALRQARAALGAARHPGPTA